MNKRYDTRGLSVPRASFLVLNYFVGYVVLIPFLLNYALVELKVSLMTYEILSWCAYLYMIITALVVGFPILKESIQNIKSYRKLGETILISFVALYVLNILSNSIVSIVTGLEQSANQEAIIHMFNVQPVLITFTTIIYAPIVEEIVFRGAIFRPLRYKTNFYVAALVSGLTFGLVHVMDSLLLGNFLDLAYLFSYAILGFVFCFVYEKHQSIIGTMCLHFLNNLVGLIGIILLQFI